MGLGKTEVGQEALCCRCILGVNSMWLECKRLAVGLTSQLYWKQHWNDRIAIASKLGTHASASSQERKRLSEGPKKF